MLNVIVISCVFVSAKGYDLSRLVDLSLPLGNDTLTWNPDDKFATIKQLVVDKPNSYFYAANNFIGPEHGGTHLDAPYHFNKNGLTVEKIPLDRLISSGVFIDVSDEVNNNSSFELLPEHLEKWEKIHGRIPNGIVLLKFGWSERNGDRVAYFGNVTAPYSFPGISEAAAKWFVHHGGIYGVGLDTPSLDPGSSKTFLAHITLFEAGIYGLENLSFRNIHLPAKGIIVVALPMKITHGTGAPCRVVAIG